MVVFRATGGTGRWRSRLGVEVIRDRRGSGRRCIILRMKRLLSLILLAAIAGLVINAQTSDGVERRPGMQTMKQLVRGTEYAATSMAPQATLDRRARAARRRQRVRRHRRRPGRARPGAANLNGVGSDAMLLIYDAKAKKVFSLNAEGTAPKLATIEWYKTNQGGKIPVNDSLLSGTVPGVVDAWYILLSRWGTKTFARSARARHRTGRARHSHGPPVQCARAQEVSVQHEASMGTPTARLEGRRGLEESRSRAHLAPPGGSREAGIVERPPGRSEGRPRPLL